MLIVPAETARRIDENRGDMGQAEFIGFLIDSHFREDNHNNDGHYVTREQFTAFEQGMKELFRSFLDFFLSLGVEMDSTLAEAETPTFDSKLRELEERLEPTGGEARAKIKWK